MNLRQRTIIDMKTQNLKNWSMPITLIDPNGIKYDTDNETGEDLKAIQILYDYQVENPDTGVPMTIKEPVVVIALSSLSRVPQPGERWIINIPLSPSDPYTLSPYMITADRPPEGGESLGFIRIYPEKADQL